MLMPLCLLRDRALVTPGLRRQQLRLPLRLLRTIATIALRLQGIHCPHVQTADTSTVTLIFSLFNALDGPICLAQEILRDPQRIRRHKAENNIECH